MRITHSPSSKFRPSPSKLQLEYSNKLELIDKHIRKSDQKPQSSLQFQAILKLIACKLQLEPPQQLFPFAAKTIIFDRKQPKCFFIKQLTAPQNKQFILNVNTHIPVKIVMKIDQMKAKSYYFEGCKAITISNSFHYINLELSVQKTGMFSTVKLLLDQMQKEYTDSKNKDVCKRPNVDNEIEQYLAQTRGKSAQIIKSRSLARFQQVAARKTISSFKSLKCVDVVKTKSQLQIFQRQKSFYMKHVRKMSPDKVHILNRKKQQYYSSKKQQIANLTMIALTSKFGLFIKQKTLERILLNLKKIKITFLCLDFIKIIKNKFKLKITEKARSRMTIYHMLQLIPSVMRKNEFKVAKQTIRLALKPYMDYRAIQQLGENSVYYLQKINFIQNYFRKKIINQQERGIILINKLNDKLRLSLPEEKRKIINQKYLKFVKQKNDKILALFTYNSKLMDLMMEKN